MKNLTLYIPVPPPVHGVSLRMKAFTDKCREDLLPVTVRRTSPLRDTKSRKSLFKQFVLLWSLIAQSIVDSAFNKNNMICICCATKGVALYRDLLIYLPYKIFGRERVVYVRGTELSECGYFKRALIRGVYRNGRFLFVSKELEETHSWLHNGNTADVIPNGVKDVGFRKRGEHDGEEIKVLFFSNVFKEKGIEEFINVVTELHQRGVSVRGKICGALSSKYSAVDIDGLTDGLVSNGIVEVVGEVPNSKKAIFFHWADVLLFPSRKESFGNVLIEAMSAGLPIISSRTTSVDFILDNGAAGIIADNYVNDAVSILVRFHEIDWRRLSNHARERYEKEFTEKEYLVNLEKYFWPEKQKNTQLRSNY